MSGNGDSELVARSALEDLGHPFSGDGFLDAVRKGDVNAVQLYIHAGMSPAATPEGSDLSPIDVAIAADKGEVVVLLIRSGASPDARDSSGATPLMSAIWRRANAAAQVLVENGAAVNTRDARGRTALMLATVEGQVEIVKLLLDHGAHTGAADEQGATALLHAVQQRATELVELLARAGADLKARGADGLTAAELAQRLGFPDVLHLLQRAERGELVAPARERQPAAFRKARIEDPLSGRRRVLILSAVAVLMLCVSGISMLWMTSLTSSLPRELRPTPQIAAEKTLAFVVEEVEAFRLENGRLPGDLDEVNLQGRGDFSYVLLDSGRHYAITVVVESVTARFESMTKGVEPQPRPTHTAGAR